MKSLKDTGFVIRRTNFGEADRYVTLFTREHGKIAVVAKSVRKITSRRAASIELLNLVDFHAIETSRNYILTETRLLSSCQGPKEDFGKVPSLFLICELIDKLCPDHQPHQDIFTLLFNTLKHLNSSDKPDLLQDFQIQLLSILGFWDKKREFNTHEDMNTFIENILERKIKTRMVFEV